MDSREAKAFELADRGRVVRKGADSWVVFSLNSPEKYLVHLNPPQCSCKDWELTQSECKHIKASQICRIREEKGISPQPEPTEPPINFPRQSYAQPDWPAYEAAQVHEKDEFLALLADLCPGLTRSRVPARDGPGCRWLMPCIAPA